MKRRFLLFLVVLLSACTTSSEQVGMKVSDVPNTRLQSDFIHISDPNDLVSEEYEDKINSVLDSIRPQADVFVVVLSSIGDQPIETFATDLFEYWGIGDAESNNGLLMLMVEDQHKIKIETGYGLETVLPDALCQRIDDSVIIPYFKEGKYGEGLYAGACAVAGALGYLPDDASVSYDEISHLKSTPPTPTASEESMDTIFLFKWSFWRKVLWYGFLLFAFGFLVVAIRELCMTVKTIKHGKNDGEILQALNKMRRDSIAIIILSIFCFPVLPVGILYLILHPIMKKKYRHTQRFCSCGHQMRLLKEKEEDAYMNENQIFEEEFGVKDFDVWLCDSCGETQVLAYEKLKAAKYYVCPDCQCLAAKKQHDTTEVEATVEQEGKGLHHCLCMKCNHEVAIEYVIPKVTQSSSSSYSGSHSSSHSRSHSSYHSSRGGSFGGGRSGGGGHTGSW